jgi:hypothetical protein
LASRGEIHQTYLGLAGKLQRSASDNWSIVRDKLLIAQVNLDFDDLSTDMPIATPEGNSDQ